MTTFWSWLVFGIPKGRAGYRNLINGWLLIHLVVALTAYMLIPAEPYEFASKVLLPSTSILVSMSIAWTARAAAILQDHEFRARLLADDRSLEDYIYGYQLSILVIIVMVVYAALMASGGIAVYLLPYNLNESVAGIGLYFMLSLGLHECWAAVNFSNLLTLLHADLKKRTH